MVVSPSPQGDSSSSTFLVDTSGKKAAACSRATSGELKFLTSDEVVIGQELGAGSFSTVYKARIVSTEPASGQSSSSLKEYALKRLSHKSQDTHGPSHRRNALLDLRNEATILSTLPPHRNIIRLHALSSHFWNDDDDENDNGEPSSASSPHPPSEPFMVLELLVETLHDRLQRIRKQEKFRTAQQGKTSSLASRLQQFIIALPASSQHETPRMRIQQAQLSRLYSVGLPICRGATFLHQHNVAIRDLKPSNIGFDAKGRVKLLDFGLARIVTSSGCNASDDGVGNNDDNPETRHVTSLGTGTVRYMAPEIMLTSGGSTERGMCNLFASDVYSLSVVLWEVMTTQLPFADIRDLTVAESKVTQQGTRPSLRAVESKKVRDILQAGWDASPQTRPRAGTMSRQLEAHVVASAAQTPTGHT